jgi:hypothetical protein
MSGTFKEDLEEMREGMELRGKRKLVPSSTPSADLLAAACRIIEKLVEKANVDFEYDEHKCPNDKPCDVCRLVTEAKAFISANAKVRG